VSIPRRIHVTGGPGCGKSTFARRLGESLGYPVYHLDEMALDQEAKMPARDAFSAVAGDLPRLIDEPRWISEGSYLGWAAPLPAAADLVVWLNVPARVALYRIMARHLKAEVARNNRFPGWRRLAHFWLWSYRYFAERNARVLGFFGVPETRSHAAELLRPYRDKLVVYRDKQAIERLAGGSEFLKAGRRVAERPEL